MTIRHLQIFVTVADCGKMRAAADKLHISQPTVSQAVRELEDYYNVKLFERLSQRIYITETGRGLLPYARHIIDSFENMEGFLKDSAIRSVIRVGGSVSVGTRLLPPIIKSLEKEAPDTDVRVTVDNTSVIEGMIQKSELDIAIVEGIVRNDELIKQDIYDDELVLVVGPGHCLFSHPQLRLEELTNHALISRESGSVERNQFEQFLLEHEIKMKNKWSCSNTETIKKAVLNGEGIAILSKMVIEREIALGEVRALDVENIQMKRKIKLIYHKNKFISRSMTRFIDICTEGRYEKEHCDRFKQ